MLSFVHQTFPASCVYLMRKRWLNGIKRRNRKTYSQPPSFKYFFKLVFCVVFLFSLGIFFSYPLLLQQFFSPLEEKSKKTHTHTLSSNKKTTSKEFFSPLLLSCIMNVTWFSLASSLIFTSYVHFS